MAVEDLQHAFEHSLGDQWNAEVLDELFLFEQADTAEIYTGIVQVGDVNHPSFQPRPSGESLAQPQVGLTDGG